jgi:hypothetical protein
VSDAYYECRRIELQEFTDRPQPIFSSKNLPVSPAQLFASFGSAEDWETWVPIIDSVTWTSPQPFGPGATRSVKTTDGATAKEEFIAWEPGKRIAFRFNETTNARLQALAEDYRVEETDTGCRLTWTMILEIKGIPGVVMRLFAPVMRWNQRRFLRRLAALLEQRAVL